MAAARPMRLRCAGVLRTVAGGCGALVGVWLWA
jgi:hypothetical protein